MNIVSCCVVLERSQPSDQVAAAQSITGSHCAIRGDSVPLMMSDVCPSCQWFWQEAGLWTCHVAARYRSRKCILVDRKA